MRKPDKIYLMESEGRRIHGLAAQARERGEHLESLKLNEEALLAYQKDGDILGFAEALSDRVIVLNHLFEETNDRVFIILAKNTARASVEIAEYSGDKTAIAIPYFNLAKVQTTMEEYKEALESYKKAVENIINNPPSSNNRASIVADFKAHTETAAYKAGDKSALERAEMAIAELEQVPVISDEDYLAKDKLLAFNEEVSYNKNVWLSGAHMRIAEMLKKDNPSKAKEHLQKAKEIIDSDERLKIRKSQWEKLAEENK